MEPAMLATLAGDLCLVLGLAVLLLPLLVTELSRPRDGVWGAVVLLLGLVLVTSSDRLRGAPMLAVVCAGLLISRLGSEVAQSRWQQLSPEEQQRLKSSERWATSLQQLSATFNALLSNTGQALGSLKPKAPAADRPEGSSRTGKRWVRPEPQAADAQDANAEAAKSEAVSEAVNAEAPEQEAPEPTAPDPEAATPASEDG